MLRLRAATSDAWLDVTLASFPAFLQDHAANERKAAQSALQMIAHFPDRAELVERMFEVAGEELDHFQDTHRLLAAMGHPLGLDRPDPYMGALHRWMRRGDTAESLMDRLLTFSIVEARGCERFLLLANALKDRPDLDVPAFGETLAAFYRRLAESEGRHQGCFHTLAYLYFPRKKVEARIVEVLDAEAEILGSLEIRPALH